MGTQRRQTFLLSLSLQDFSGWKKANPQAFEQPIELDDKEGYVILDLHRYLLKDEPADRLSAVDMLSHPWLKEIVL